MALLSPQKITKELKSAIAKGATDVELRKIAFDQGLVTLRKAAINKLLEGRTTIEEVFSVTVAEKQELIYAKIQLYCK